MRYFWFRPMDLAKRVSPFLLIIIAAYRIAAPTTCHLAQSHKKHANQQDSARYGLFRVLSSRRVLIRIGSLNPSSLSIGDSTSVKMRLRHLFYGYRAETLLTGSVCLIGGKYTIIGINIDRQNSLNKPNDFTDVRVLVIVD